jgi:uncharacterized Zn finger protein
MFRDYKPYVSVAERRRKARKAGASKHATGWNPVDIPVGHAIATTFWGLSWCRNIEAYSDFYNRLNRGRSYVRAGTVLHLGVEGGVAKARVMGSRMYDVTVKISPVAKSRWDAVCRSCSGTIASLVDLLQGRLSNAVMAHMCDRDRGLFPSPKEIAFTCTCPDWADMCKHVAAVLYAIGARLDQRPELLFALRGVDANELIASAGNGLRTDAAPPGSARRLENADLAALFGLDMTEATAKKTVKRTSSRKSTPRR